MANDRELTRKDVLGITDMVVAKVAVPEWGGVVFVRSMSGLERDEYERAITANGGIDFENARAKLASITVCDAEGMRLFGEEDVAALGAKSARALQRIFIKAQQLSGLTMAEIREMTKELEANPLEGSASS